VHLTHGDVPKVAATLPGEVALLIGRPHQSPNTPALAAWL
jgi:hypothetical protein